MTTIYALKDKTTGLYLTKSSALKELCSNTKTFSKKERAYAVAKGTKAYFWIAIANLTKGKRGYRVNIGSQEFTDYLYDLRLKHPLEVVEIEIEESEV